MKAANLDRARQLLADLQQARDLARRLTDGEALTVTLGEGPHATGLALSVGYEKGLRGDLFAALRARADVLAGQLAALGVEEG